MAAFAFAGAASARLATVAQMSDDARASICALCEQPIEPRPVYYAVPTLRVKVMGGPRSAQGETVSPVHLDCMLRAGWRQMSEP